MSDSMPPLDRRLLAALRSDEPAPSDAKSRVRGRLAAVIPAIALGGAAVGAGGSSGSFWRRFGGWGPHGVAAATFIAGGVAGATLLATFSHAPPPRIVYVDRPATPAVVAEASAFSGPPRSLSGPARRPAAALATPLPEPAAVAAPLSAPASPAATPPAHMSRFAEERALLDDARANLLQGEPARALERLDAHRTRFADGMLAEERDAMEVEALVRAGRVDEARAEAAAFEERSPRSLFLQTVESAVPSAP